MYTIIPDAPRVGSSHRDMLGECHFVDGVIGCVTKHPHFYLASPLMPPHSSHTPSVVQPGYSFDYSRIMAQSRATPSYAPLGYSLELSCVTAQSRATSSYAPPTQALHVHGMTCLKHSCTDQTTSFAAPPSTPTYYPPPVQPTSALTPNPLATLR